MAGTSKARRRVRRTAMAPRSLPARAPGTTTVQLLPHLLSAGELPDLVVGETAELIPSIYAGSYRPGSGPFHGSAAPDHWYVDEFGCVDARGTLTSVRLDPGGECTCRIEVLDAAGHLAPVNWATTVPPEGDGPAHVEGCLYLDPEVAPGTGHGDAVALCRRRYRVTALRCYRRAHERPLGPVPLRRVPAPDEVSDDAVYVADLLPEPDELLAGAG